MVTSSNLALNPVPGLALYSSTKVYESFLAEALNYELRDKIDVLSYQPARIDTKIVPRSQLDFTTISIERAAESCFRDLGCTPMTHGAFRHELRILER